MLFQEQAGRRVVFADQYVHHVASPESGARDGRFGPKRTLKATGRSHFHKKSIS
jgi:hypothetical protein